LSRNIGIDVEAPEKECNDKKCPFHSNLSVRGGITRVKVVSTAMVNSAVVQREFRRFNKKYERYERSIATYHVHLPECLDVKQGDEVLMAECRKIAKTISHVIVGKVKQ
jgi:small subunit ribosomal protein S17